MSELKSPYLYKNFTTDYFEIKFEHNLLVHLGTNASSFYRSQNNLGWFKCFSARLEIIFHIVHDPKKFLQQFSFFKGWNKNCYYRKFVTTYRVDQQCCPGGNCPETPPETLRGVSGYSG